MVVDCRCLLYAYMNSAVSSISPSRIKGHTVSVVLNTSSFEICKLKLQHYSVSYPAFHIRLRRTGCTALGNRSHRHERRGSCRAGSQACAAPHQAGRADDRHPRLQLFFLRAQNTSEVCLCRVIFRFMPRLSLSLDLLSCLHLNMSHPFNARTTAFLFATGGL